MSSHYLIAFASMLGLMHGTIFSVLGQSTVQGYDTEDSSLGIAAEIQQLRFLLEAFNRLNEQVQGFQVTQSASFQQMMNQHDIVMRSLQAVDRRLQEHDIYIKTQSDIGAKSLQAIDRRLDGHDIYVRNQTQNSRKLANDTCSSASLLRDCSDIRASGQTASGVYEVCVRHRLDPICANAYCDMKTSTDTSLVFQRRKDGSVDFYRTWSEYKEGFGDRNGEFWLGNEMLHLLTTKRKYRLRIDLEDFEGQRRYAEYSRFVVNSSADNYRLTLGSYSGNAGDSLTYHNGQQFSTKDVDNDKVQSVNCAQTRRGAWWYDSCHNSNLNGIYHRGSYSQNATYAEGIVWHHWHGSWYSLKATELKLIPVA